MSVYEKEQPAYLDEALASILAQTILPAEIVIVKDGPLSEGLQTVLEDYHIRYPSLFRCVTLPTNKGLGSALNEGVRACRYTLIARMDTDDICHPSRFEKQLNFLQEHPEVDVVGSWIYEFSSNWRNSHFVREVPIHDTEVYQYSKTRNPLNHMTVMFRKESVLKAGNYLEMPWNEDYYLWVRMLTKGFIIRNLNEPLVYARVNDLLFKRRGGMLYIKAEYHLQREMLRYKHINFIQFIHNLLVRGFVRLIPNQIRKFVYERYLRKRIVNIGIEK